MIPLSRVGDGAPGQKGPPEEGRPAALLLQHAEVDVQRRGPVVPPQQLLHSGELAGVLHGEDVLALPVGQAVKGEAKGPAQQLGQALGKGVALGDDPDLSGGEGIAVEQHPIALGLGAAFSA